MLEDKNPLKTSISQLGEFGLIDHLTKNFKLKQKTSIRGIGDDAAVIAAEKGMQLVVSTDLLLEGVHLILVTFL
jgi:thiamine-phosphate kinase